MFFGCSRFRFVVRVIYMARRCSLNRSFNRPFVSPKYCKLQRVVRKDGLQIGLFAMVIELIESNLWKDITLECGFLSLCYVVSSSCLVVTSLHVMWFLLELWTCMFILCLTKHGPHVELHAWTRSKPMRLVQNALVLWQSCNVVLTWCVFIMTLCNNFIMWCGFIMMYWGCYIFLCVLVMVRCGYAVMWPGIFVMWFDHYVMWFRLCLPRQPRFKGPFSTSRFQRCDWREKLESYSLSTLSSPIEPSREWNL